MKDKIENCKLKIGNSWQGQAGSTLMLTVLVMATMLSSMYVMANISVRNIRQMFNSVTGEVALLAADAGLEQGLWAHIRNKAEANGDCDVSPVEYQADSLSNYLAEVSIMHCKSALMPNPSDIYIGLDDPNTTTDESEKEIFVTNPSDPEGPSGYGEATFQWLGGSGSVKVCSWNVPDCEAGPWLANFSQNDQSGPTTVTLNTADDRYIVFLEAGPVGYTVRVSAEDEAGNGRGLPADVVTVKGLGRDPIVNRVLDVKIHP